ncbi:hypothetical protein L596_007145 [Steinernema carpocapsae]|uniref:Uncharacterized protein n=1 Tax=Steinernema carpocapsae TaxID=34508 RepID=A0A4U5P9E6_STECR|nr:hypothetical protein L596_007145 [Steinernema carpocapsae]
MQPTIPEVAAESNMEIVDPSSLKRGEVVIYEIVLLLNGVTKKTFQVSRNIVMPEENFVVESIRLKAFKRDDLVTYLAECKYEETGGAIIVGLSRIV